MKAHLPWGAATRLAPERAGWLFEPITPPKVEAIEDGSSPTDGVERISAMIRGYRECNVEMGLTAEQQANGTVICSDLRRAVRHSRALGVTVPDNLLAQVAPLSREHLVLTGDYVWTNMDRAA